MDINEIRPLYEISDKELNSRIEAFKEQGKPKAMIAETPEGKEAAYRALTDDAIADKFKADKAAGLNPWSTPEYWEHVRRRSLVDSESYSQMAEERFGGKE